MTIAQLVAGFLPTNPVLEPASRAVFDDPLPAAVVYTGPAREAVPVLPVQVWGLRYALDVVIETEHPRWTMHEYARIDVPGQPSLWLAKDAENGGLQTITADVPDIGSWVPEIPVPRVQGPVVVEGGEGPKRTDLVIRYTTPAGEAAELRYSGKTPKDRRTKRNGNTMGHSRQTLAALLDLHRYQAGGKASLSFDGKPSKIKKLLGLYPIKFLIAQTQGGFAIADFFQSTAPPEAGTGAAGEGAGGSPAVTTFTVTRPVSDPAWPTHAVESWSWSDGWARREWQGPQDVVALSYHFRDGELDRALVTQRGVDPPVTEVVFRPSMPDLRRPFEGEAHSRFVVDIAGQKAHGTGEVIARWTSADEVLVEIRPDAPAWFAARPIDVSIVHEAEGVRVRAVRVPGPDGT